MSPLEPRLLQLERDLELALEHGRWLSDEERAELQRLQRERELALDQERRQRRKLLVLLVVSLLLPPLWPLALALTLYLLFPATVARLALAAGVGALVLVSLFAALVLALVVALLMAIF
jgi:hypothetical protein